MREPALNAAIYFERDGYDVAQPWLMGRQMAGNGFLRAAVAARGEGPTLGYGKPTAAEPFAQMVRAIDPQAATGWLSGARPEALSAARVCYRPDPWIVDEARLRLRAGPAAYSLCGVTHTTATAATIGQLANLLSGPLMPWDAVICTSQAVIDTVREVHAAEADYLRWRFGPNIQVAGPQLPVIPLGVHAADFAGLAAIRTDARRKLGLTADEVAVLFVGRLAFVAKAHPAQTLLALQAAQARTGKRLVLVFCGWSPSDLITQAIRDAAVGLCPDVQVRFVDGRDLQRRDECFAAGDIFISLSDNIQETFGLTPLEAMAAGLPVLVSDWNGYRETVRHGVDGFRAPTWAPAPGAGEQIARDYEGGLLDYDRYIWRALTATSCASPELVDQLCALVESPERRAEMGAAGQRRAREDFDWAVIYRRYQELWAELDARRSAAGAVDAPRVSARALDPFQAFGHYPTHRIGPHTLVGISPGATTGALEARLALKVFELAETPLPLTRGAFAAMARGPLTIADLGHVLRCSWQDASHAAGLLAKMGLAVFQPPQD